MIGFDRTLGPKVGFSHRNPLDEKVTPIESETFKKMIEPFANELEARKKEHENTLEKHVMDLGASPEVGMISGTASVVSTVAFGIFFILSLTVLPFAPMALFCLAGAAVMAYAAFKDFNLIFNKIAKVAQKMQHCEEWAKAVRTPEWQTLDFLEPFRKLRNRAAERINKNLLTKEDLRAILYIMEKKKNAKSAKELDEAADQLKREWKAKVERSDWAKRLYAL